MLKQAGLEPEGSREGVVFDFADLGMQEMLVVLLVALVFIGPRRLPEIARTLGRAINELRRAGEELKSQIDLSSWTEEQHEDLKNSPPSFEPEDQAMGDEPASPPLNQEHKGPQDEAETQIPPKAQT